MVGDGTFKNQLRLPIEPGQLLKKIARRIFEAKTAGEKIKNQRLMWAGAVSLSGSGVIRTWVWFQECTFQLG